MRKLLLVATLALASTAAHADMDIQCSSTEYGGQFHAGCHIGDGTSKQASDLRTPEERAAQDRKWEAFCKPEKHTDNLGMTRMVYAHPGCDVGRAE
jgi:hypothetical protein